MNIVIYGIDESDFRCGGCLEAKKVLNALSLPYIFKRIITRNDGYPEYDKALMSELSTKIKFTTLILPYIFIDNEMVKIKDLREYLTKKGYDLEEID